MTKKARIIIGAIAGLGLISMTAHSAEEGMPRMPKIAPKKSYTVQSIEQGKTLLEERGYGDQEPMVRMMNLMMVGGSGYEGMDMQNVSEAAAPKVPSPAEGQTASFDVQSKLTPDPARVGANTLEIEIHQKNGGTPVKGLKIRAQVYMTSMDMGTEEPAVKETAPGKYQVKVAFPMAGPWAVKLLLPEGGEKVLPFDVKH
ncbi:MAG: FixH family protein [Bdellovibrionia bacterium]